MAREILFKAKRECNGEWVEGSPVFYESGEVAIFNEKFTRYGHEATQIWKRTLVDKDTLCQYTGLTDKNGNKIWENDVCTCKKRGCAFFGSVVKWNQVKARFDVNAMGCNFSMTLEECLDGVSINGLDYEVIGNIFDNPELLTE